MGMGFDEVESVERERRERVCLCVSACKVTDA